MTIEEVLGDTAYSERRNLEYAKEKDIALILKLNPSISQGVRKKEDEFEFNKDADLFVCPDGHMAVIKKELNLKLTQFQ